MTPATVTATSPLQVRLDGAATATNALRLDSYTPAVDDRVAVVQFGSRLLVLGKAV